jgi:uncharacterized protein (DUF1697 family)
LHYDVDSTSLWFSTMPVIIAMLRGVNLGPHKRIKMRALCAICKALKLEDPHTYVQSGNVIFKTKESDLDALGTKIQKAIERKAGFSCDVILRTPEEFRRAIAASPFSKRTDIHPSKLLVTFLAAEPAKQTHTMLKELSDKHPEELHLVGRELYIYFPNGAGKTRLPWSSVEKLLKVTGTARNWNSVTKMLEMAQEMETAAAKQKHP